MPRKSEASAPRRRLLVVRAGALGDTLLGLPTLAALRELPGRPQLTLAGPLPAARLAIETGAVDTICGVDDPVLAPLFAEGTALERVPERVPMADAAVVWLRRPETVAENLRRLGMNVVVAAPPFPPEGCRTHAADWLLGTLSLLPITPRPDWDSRPWLMPTAEAMAWAATWHDQQLGGVPYVVLHPSSGSVRKNWPAEQWVEVVRLLRNGIRGLGRDSALVVTAGPADGAALASVEGAFRAAGVPPPEVILREIDLMRLAAVLARTRLYLGNDSGVSHLAAAAGAPVVAVFGPTDPAVWRPRGPCVRVLGGVPCGPRLDNSTAEWPAVKQVIEASLQILGRPE